MAARLRTGDTVVVISGKDKGKTGTVLAVFAEDDKVVVEGVNVRKRHMKPNARNQQGGIFEKAMPLHACKVMPVDPKTGKGTRVSFKTDDKGNKVRIAKSGEVIVNVKRSKADNADAEKAAS
jgi:large subunit ribosomal protein L24